MAGAALASTTVSNTTHAELVFNTLRYVTETLADGDVHAVLDLGFRSDQVARLERLTLRDLRHLSHVRTHFLDVAVNAACFDRVLNHMRRNQHEYDLQEDLIRLRAPLEMMRAFFGMSNGEYAARRQILGLVGTGIGRPAAATEEEERRIWEVWHANRERPPRQRYLEVAKTTGIPLNTIWAVIREWKTAGVIAPPASADGANIVPLRRDQP